MRLGDDGFFQLTYCTNIHPANGWLDVLTNVQCFVPALKARFAPDRPFGIGLRLSGDESRELLDGNSLREFATYLQQHGLYVFTLNGFPYGPFHRQPVKADVHAPDWRYDERVRYTLRLVEILAGLLPSDTEGGISTSPLSYKTWVDSDDPSTWQRLVANVVRVAAELVRVRRERDRLIHLDLEPEPDGLLEDGNDAIAFYTRWLLPVGSPLLADALGLSTEDARRALLEHIRVCFDTCHMAVAYQDFPTLLDRFAATGIQLGKVQVSSALRVDFPADGADRPELVRALHPFAESVYLHQVGEARRDGSVRQYPDLEAALPAVADPEIAEWRIHFHTPIFVERYGRFGSTQDSIRQTFALLHQRRFCRLLEIETYTWDVLPGDLKRDLVDSIAREYEWVLDVFAQSRP